MSEGKDLSAALEPLISRVSTDVTAVKTDRGMAWAKGEALTQERLKRHLNGGPARGVCPIKAGESTTMVALFDLDSHRGQTPWNEMVAAAEACREEAVLAYGIDLIPFRSSGGNGIHLFAVWDEPQDAYSVRQAMAHILDRAGFKNGTKGVAAGEVEVFPKQDAVPLDGFGNQFILPLAGKSEPLDPDLEFLPAGRDFALEVEWRASEPVPVLEPPVREARGPVDVTDADLKLLQAALAAIPNDGEGLGYDEWRNIVVGVHAATGGSEEGYALALEFSERSSKFEDETELREKVWEWADASKPGGITVGTVLAAARAAGWQDVTADDFPVLEEPPAGDDDALPAQRVLDPKDVMLLARAFMRGAHTKAGRATLLRAGGLWYEHEGPCWREAPDEEVRQGAWVFLDSAKKEVSRKVAGEDGKKAKTVTDIKPFCPSLAQVSATFDALKAVAGVKGVAPPCWLPGYKGPEAREVVSLADGLLHIPSRQLLPHTPGFFTVNTLPYGWGADEEPVEWLKFLEAVWPGDVEAQQALQEVFGYLLTADTSQQKMFLIRGPKRSGKGTIARVLGALLGRENMVSPTLTSLTSNFGLQPLIGKLVAMIPDARVGGQTNTQAVVEKLLMLSGEDSITVDRKNKEAWTGQLSARVVIMTNEVPRLGDASGALAGRFVVISMDQSFYGREDLGLTSRLLKELPGIFRWALDGRDRLRRRGHFVQPASAQEDVEALQEANSPVSVFVDEVMELGADFTVTVQEAFEAWQSWCGRNGQTHPGTAQTFSEKLRAACPSVGKRRPRTEDRAREFTAIRIKPHVRQELGLFS